MPPGGRARPAHVHGVRFTNAGNILGAAVGQQLGYFIRRGMNVAPTLEIRPGYPFTVMVTQDVVFPGSYTEARQE